MEPKNKNKRTLNMYVYSIYISRVFFITAIVIQQHEREKKNNMNASLVFSL